MSTTIEHETQQPVVAVASKTTTALAVVTKSIEEINAVEATISELETKYKGVVFQVGTPEGMKEARKARAEIRAPRYALQHIEKATNSTLNDLKASVSEQVGTFVPRIKAVEDPVHQQIVGEEQREADEKKARAEAKVRRVAEIQARIDAIRTAAMDAVGKSSREITKLIETVDGTAIDESFAELRAQAEGAKSTALVRLRMMLTNAENAEAEQRKLAEERAELARQQAEEKRVSAIRTRIDGIRVLRNIHPGADSAGIASAIESAKTRLIDDSYAELRDEAQTVLQETIEILTTMHDGRRAHEEAQTALAAERERVAAEALKAEKREITRKKIHEINCWIVSSSMAATPEAYDRAISAVKKVALDEQTFGDLVDEARGVVESTLAQLTQDRAELVAELAEQERVETDQRRRLAIQAIRNQLALAIVGSSDDDLSNARRLIMETLAETVDTDVSIERFGDRAHEATTAKNETLAEMRKLVAKLNQREAAEQRAAIEREELADRQRTLEADQKRLDEERAELDRRQAEPIAPAPSPGSVEPATESSETPDGDPETAEASAPSATDIVSPTRVNPFDGRDEPETATTDRRALTVSDPSTLEGLKCQEASVLSFATYIPCGAPAGAVVWHEKDKRAYIMCAECAWHNVKNRGGRLLMATDQRAIP